MCDFCIDGMVDVVTSSYRVISFAYCLNPPELRWARSWDPKRVAWEAWAPSAIYSGLLTVREMFGLWFEFPGPRRLRETLSPLTNYFDCDPFFCRCALLAFRENTLSSSWCNCFLLRPCEDSSDENIWKVCVLRTCIGITGCPFFPSSVSMRM